MEATRPDDLELTIAKGSTILLYTDGLIERRDIPIGDGIGRLTRLAGAVAAGLDAFCQRLLDELTSAPNPDDVAIVAVRRR